MRDREYESIKPAKTYRIVLLGASNDMGFGVNDDQTYENVVEDYLNQRLSNPQYSRYEILNLSVAAHSVLQRLLRLEQEGFALQPDAAILSVSAADMQFLPANLRKALIAGIEPPPEYRDIVESVVRKAHVNGKMPPVMIERRLQPYVTELCGCRSNDSHSNALSVEFVRCSSTALHPRISPGRNQPRETNSFALPEPRGLR